MELFGQDEGPSVQVAEVMSKQQFNLDGKETKPLCSSMMKKMSL